MPNWRRIILTCLTLTTFLVASSPVAVRLAAPSNPKPFPSASPLAQRCCCKHAHHSRADAATDRQDRAPMAPERSSDCPCPGGCALCSVAKVPCPAPTVGVLFPLVSLEESLPDAALVVPSPSNERLIRPPRA